jgi:hypothetical protein
MSIAQNDATHIQKYNSDLLPMLFNKFRRVHRLRAGEIVEVVLIVMVEFHVTGGAASVKQKHNTI